jgi:ATPase complex subunit ATP10
VTKITETREISDEIPAIPPLRRPLGVPDVPTTKIKTLSERSADFLDQEKQLEKRRHLCVPISTCNSVEDTMWI